MSEDLNIQRTLNGRDERTGQFVMGHTGIGGRPRGSRNKLGEQLISDLHAEWQKSGAAALKRVAEDDPVAFVKVVASILPREIDATLSIDTDLFAECRDFAAAFRLSQQVIGGEIEAEDLPLVIEAETEPSETDG